MVREKSIVDDTCRVYYLKETEIIQFVPPIMVDLTRVLYGRLTIISQELYPLHFFVNVEVVLNHSLYSLVGQVTYVKPQANGLNEMMILLESVPESFYDQFENVLLESLL